MMIGITLKENAYTPEAFAYKEYLETHGHKVELCPYDDFSENNDLNIIFMGLHKKRTKASFEIHEYQSLSTPPFAAFKDTIKSFYNSTPDGRIFLNKFVKDSLKFKKECPYIYRDMGVNKSFFKKSTEKKIFDLVYCGSVSGRPGLIEEINKLSKLGLKICVIGKINDKEYEKFSTSKNIHFTGRLSLEEIKYYYDISTAGLNFTPDLIPFNKQTSTKTLEYLAAGLKLVTNNYSWIEDFCFKEKINFISLEKIKSKECIEKHIQIFPIMEKYNWENILKQSRFNEYIINITHEII